MAESHPIVCTLQGPALPERVAWIQDLLGQHLLARREDGLVLHLTFAIEAAEGVAELVRRESACCAFLTFEQAVQDGTTHLTITAPEEARESAPFIFSTFDRSSTALTSGTTQHARETRPPGLFGAVMLGLSALTASCNCAKEELAVRDHAPRGRPS